LVDIVVTNDDLHIVSASAYMGEGIGVAL
jgi:hypothetical protein